MFVMARKSTTTVEVEIFGATYHVRGDNDGTYLEELASLVDGKMQEIAAHLGTSDRTKIAILAALNIADELVQSGSDLSAERETAVTKVAELTGELSQAL